jgi:hypothetical protein
MTITLRNPDVRFSGFSPRTNLAIGCFHKDNAGKTRFRKSRDKRGRLIKVNGRVLSVCKNCGMDKVG